MKTAQSIGEPRRAQIAVEIVDIPREIIRSRLADPAMRFAPLVRSVAFEIPTPDTAFASGLPMSTRLATIPLGLLRDARARSIRTASGWSRCSKLRQCRLIVKDVDPASRSADAQEAG